MDANLARMTSERLKKLPCQLEDLAFEVQQVLTLDLEEIVPDEHASQLLEAVDICSKAITEGCSYMSLSLIIVQSFADAETREQLDEARKDRKALWQEQNT